MSDYFSKFLPDETVVRNAVGEISANYRLLDEVDASPHRRVLTQGVTYGYGSKEVKPGTVKAPGTRRVSKGPARKQRWAKS